MIVTALASALRQLKRGANICLPGSISAGRRKAGSLRPTGDARRKTKLSH